MAEKMKNIKSLVYLSRAGALEKDSPRIYNTLFKLQKSLGCTFRKLDVNHRQFDNFVGQAYMKAMTEKKTSKTFFLLGKDQHGVAGQGDFDIDPDPYINKTGKGFGNLIRWAHLGDTLDKGIILVDFELNGHPNLGNARNLEEVKEILEYISNLGFPSKKIVYLTDCSKIYEPEIGKIIRESRGLLSLEDWIKDDFKDIALLAKQTSSRKKRVVRREQEEGYRHPLARASSALTASWG